MKKNLLPNLYIGTGGGLGDVIRQYLKEDMNWGRLEAIKTQQPSIEIKASFCCHNDGIVELFRYHPYISFAENFPYEHDPWPAIARKANGYTHIRDVDVSSFKHTRPKFYISQKEQKTLNDICALGPYVAVHVFAGDANRIPLQPQNYLPILERIYKELGLRSVLIGKSGDRCLTNNPVFMTEYIQTESVPWITNMLNLSNPRLDIKIVESETAFIGTHSCYVLPSWIYEKPSVLVAPTWLHTNLTTRDDCSWATKYHAPYSRVVYTPVPYELVNDRYSNVDVVKTQNDIFNQLKALVK